MAEITLLNLPFAPCERASVQMGILSSLLRAVEIPFAEQHLNLDFFALLLEHGYGELCGSTMAPLVAEWLFSASLPPAQQPHQAYDPGWRRQLQAFAEAFGLDFEDLLRIRTEVAPGFVARVGGRSCWDDCAIACFSLTYPQINASLALMATLKQNNPELKTVAGGAYSKVHPESARAFLDAFPQLDLVVVGEAEPFFADLISLLRQGESQPPLPGVYWRGRAEDSIGEAPFLDCADLCAVPDFRGFEEAVLALPEDAQTWIESELPLELARGCPRRCKKPCAFCGFYPLGGFRPKSKARIFEEIDTQLQRHDIDSIYLLDAAVTPAVITRTLAGFPTRYPGVPLAFAEIRPDLKRRHLETLARAGTRLVQPGIESLDDRLLDRLRKGVTVFDNLLLLKWCRELGIRVSYNILLEIPGATEEELRAQLRLLTRLTHLDPPCPMNIQLVRFSAYRDHPGRHGLGNLRPHPAYRHMFSPDLDLERVAYEFEADRAPVPQQVNDSTRRQIGRWQRWWPMGAHLECVQDGDGVVLEDGRNPNRPPLRYRLTGVGGSIYAALMDRPLSYPELVAMAAQAGDKESEAWCAGFMANLDQNGLVLESGAKYLGLATWKI